MVRSVDLPSVIGAVKAMVVVAATAAATSADMNFRRDVKQCASNVSDLLKVCNARRLVVRCRWGGPSPCPTRFGLARRCASRRKQSPALD